MRRIKKSVSKTRQNQAQVACLDSVPDSVRIPLVVGNDLQDEFEASWSGGIKNKNKKEISKSAII